MGPTGLEGLPEVLMAAAWGCVWPEEYRGAGAGVGAVATEAGGLGRETGRADDSSSSDEYEVGTFACVWPEEYRGAEAGMGAAATERKGLESETEGASFSSPSDE